MEPKKSLPSPTAVPLACSSIYATDAAIMGFPKDIMILMFQRKCMCSDSGAQGVTNVPVAEIHMSPEAFKDFARAVAGQLGAYGKQYGEISLAEGPPADGVLQ